MIKKGLKVVILAGKDKKKEGEVIEIDRQNNRFKTGDKVSIIESKPFSKNKKYEVMDGIKWYKYKLNC